MPRWIVTRRDSLFSSATFRSTGYDALSRRTSETDESGRTTTFAYDALGRLVAVTDALGQVTAYGYDEAGNRTAQTDANGRTTRFEYDSAGRPTKRVLPDGLARRIGQPQARQAQHHARRAVGVEYVEIERDADF